MVGPLHHARIVVGHQQGISQGEELAQHLGHARLRRGMQTEGRLVEDHEHAPEPLGQLRSEPQPLSLAPRERGASPVEAEVPEAQLNHTPQPRIQRRPQRPEHRALRQGVEPRGQLCHRKLQELRQRDAPHPRLAPHCSEPRALAGAAGNRAHEA